MRLSFFRKTWILFAAITVWIGVSPAFPGGAKEISRGIWDVDGYRVDVSAHQQGDDICLRGRTTYGPACSRLQMKFKLENQAGHAQTITTVVEDAGGSGSRTIREDVKCKKEIKKIGPRWVIEDISTRCLD